MATLSFSQARLVHEPIYFLPTELGKGTPGHSILDSQLRLPPCRAPASVFPFTLTIEYSSAIGMQYDVKPMYNHALPRSN